MANLHLAIAAAALFLAAAASTFAQDIALPGMETLGVDNGAAPVAQYGGGSFFSQDLGTILRLRYNTESYGQTEGNFDIGTMQFLTFDDAALFFDGQITLNDVQGVGFNLGTGYRWMHFPSYAQDTGRVDGVSIWADGASTGEGGFFPQLGLSLESLGDVWDFRANGYLPLGPQDQTGEFEPTGLTNFQGNSISELSQAVVHSSLAVAEVEAARRLGSERDAWAFAGPYYLGNDDDEATGFRAGVRGYAYPDLLVQVAVSDDELFKTNATFSVIWFVGRTRTDFQPACGVPDRFREPVLRNDYVTLAQSFVDSGVPLTQPDGSALRIVHVDSNAAPGGDGTFENPFDMLTDVNGGGSLDGDIILAHAESVFTGEAPVELKVDQRLLGEGDGIIHTVATAEQGTLDIPETAPGARDAPKPRVTDTMANAIVLANDNEVRNFAFEDVAGNAIFSTGLTGNANLRDLDVLRGGDFAISFLGTETTGTVTLNEFTYDGGGAAAGGVELSNFDGAFRALNSTLTNGTLSGVRIADDAGDDSDGTFTFESTFTIDSVDADATGAAFDVNGFTGAVTMDGTIDTDTGRSVFIQNMDTGALVTFRSTADITHTTTGADSEGVLIRDNAAGAVAFNGDLVLTTDGSIAFDVDEADQDVTLTANSANNSINTDNATALRIVGANISTSRVDFFEINRMVAAPATSAVVLEDNTGGAIRLGDVGATTAGDSGTLVGGAGADTVVINDSANVVLSALIINNAAGSSGVHVEKNVATTTQTVFLNDLDINAGDRGVEVSGMAGAGALTMTVNDTTIDESTDTSLRFNAVNGGSITTTNVDITNTTAGAGISVTGATGTSIYTFNDTTVETTSGDGVSSSGNASTTTIIYNGVDVTTTSGDGFTATGDGSLRVSGGNNVISTDSGVGLTIDGLGSGMNIQTEATFESVTVDGVGAVNGIVLRDITGAQVTVGETGGADGAGGELTTTNDAIIVENVANVDFNSVRVNNASAGAARGVHVNHTSAANMDVTFNNLDVLATGAAGMEVDHTSANLFNLRLNASTLAEQVDMDISGGGQLQLLVDDTSVTTGDVVAFDIAFTGGAADGDVTIRNTSTFTSNNARAFVLTVDGAGKSVEVNVDNNTFTRTVAAAAGDRTVEMFATGGATLNANVVNNSFNNSGAGEGLLIDSNVAATVVNLNLINNGPAGADLRLRETAGDFNVVDLVNVDGNNPGDVILEDPGDFDTIMGPVEAPTLPP